MRVVSVLPSATEIVHALGHGSDLVGRSAECDYPAVVRSLPVVMWPKSFDQDRPSVEIDRRVQSVRGAGESLYELDVARLRELRPDLLLTQDLCGVCSVTDREVEDACARAGVRPHIVSLAPRRLEEVWESIETVGTALADPAAGARLARLLRARTGGPGRSRPTGPRVAVVEWLDPPILAGLWSPDIISAAGGVPVGADAGRPGVRTSWTEVAALRPDLVVLSPCSFPTERTLRELADPRVRASVASLARTAGVYVADEAYFSRPGPRLADGVELVRGLIEGRRDGFPMPVDRWVPAPAEAPA